MIEEKFCYKHNSQPTRVTCSSCSNPICTKCMVSASVGYKCPDCSKVVTHSNQLSSKHYTYAVLSGLLAGIAAGFIWNCLKGYGFFVSMLVAYSVGFCVSKFITKVIGYKSDPRLKVLVGVFTVIGMVYNPIVIATNSISTSFVSIIIALTLFSFSSLFNILALVIAVWAAVRHLDF